MALTYRSPVEEVLNRFTSEEQSRISRTAIDSLTTFEKKNNHLFSFAMKEKAKEKLISVGIYLSPYSFTPHSHPVCKTLENHILYNVLCDKLDNSFFFLGIKNSKLNFIKARNANVSLVDCLNRIVTSADNFRYGSSVVNAPSGEIENLKSKHSLSCSPSLRDLLPHVIKCKSRNIFIHDELHYWTQEDLMTFLSAVRPNMVIATFVFPTEILAGASASLNPWCYKFSINKEKLHFFPDGVASEAYTQPLGSGMFLKVKCITLPNGDVYGLDLVYNAFAHSVLCISKGSFIGQESRFFSNFDAVCVGDLRKLSNTIRGAIPVSFTVISKLYRYVRTLKTPDVQSCMAKLSQIVPEPSCHEIKFAEDFGSLVISNDKQMSMFNPSVMKAFKMFFANLLPDQLARFSKTFQSMTLDSFISHLEPFFFEVKTFTLDSRRMPLFDFIHYCEFTPDLDLPELMNRFEDGIWGIALERGRSPYSFECTDGFYCLFDQSNVGPLVSSLAHLMVDSNSSGRGSVISADECVTILHELISGHFRLKDFRLDLKATVDAAISFYLTKGVGRFVWVPVSSGLLWFLSRNRRCFRFIEASRSEGHASLELKQSKLYQNLVSCIGSLGVPVLKSAFVGLKKEKPFGSDFHVSFSIQPSEVVNCSSQVEIKQTPHEAEATLNLIKTTEKDVSNIAVLESESPKSNSSIESFSDYPVSALEDIETLAVLQNITMGFVDESQISVCEDISDMICKSLNSFKRLRGRRASFKARCHCIEYGHDKVTYETEAWSSHLSALLQGRPDFYNACLVQYYEKNGEIGFHADDEKCYLDSSILTFNLDGYSVLSIKRKGGAFGSKVVTFLLKPGMFFEMKPGFQRLFLHSIKSLNEGRVSLTYRQHVRTIKGEPLIHCCGDFSDKEFLIDSVFERAPELDIENFNIFEVPGDGNCFWHAVGMMLGVDGEGLKQAMRIELERSKKHRDVPALREQIAGNKWAEREAIAFLCSVRGIEFFIISNDSNLCYRVRPTQKESYSTIFLNLDKEHFRPCVPKNGCVVRAIAGALNKSEPAVLSVLCRPENQTLFDDLIEGDGMTIQNVERAMQLFGIKAHICSDAGNYWINDEGKIPAFFELNKDHLMHVKSGDIKGKVVMSRHVPTPVSVSSSSYGILDQVSSKVKYRPNLERAKLLSQSLSDGTTGVICDKLTSCQPDFLPVGELVEVKEHTIGLILGTFGSGKSTVFKEFIKKAGGARVTFVSPRKSLASEIFDDLAESVGSRKKIQKIADICTFEVFLKKMKWKKNSVIVIDEIQLYPPGYIDLVLALAGEGNRFFLAGDPCQSGYDSNNDRFIFEDMESDIFNILNGTKYKFNVLSHRFKNQMFRGRIPCCFSPALERCGFEEYTILSSMDELCEVERSELSAVLVSSFSEKRVIQSYLGHEIKCLTFGESTGLNFRSGAVVISSEGISTDERRWLTALTRFRENLILVNLLGISIEDVAQTFNGRVLRDFLCKSSGIQVLQRMLPGEPSFCEGFGNKIGKDEGIKELKLSGDPWLKTEIFLGQLEDEEFPEIYEEDMKEEWFQTHIPIGDLESIRARWIHKIMLKEHREVRIGTEVSTQFSDEHSKNKGVKLTNAAERFEAIYPRHKGNDSVTFLMAVKKRLSFSNPPAEAAKFIRAKKYGKMLLDEFLKMVPLRREHNKRFMDEALLDFENKKVSKSAATIENHSIRSCKDWLSTVALIFMKSQFCSKWSNRFVNAKAGQTLACFHHSVLCRFAPYMRYIEKKLFEALPSNLYVHSGKGLDDLSEWVKKGIFEDECTESDYEAFDASQDHYILAFECEVMKFLGLPSDLIEDYIYIKINLGSKLGNFSIMRFTGEASTFLFNTMANMLFTKLRYDLNGSEFICFAGDDMCANRRLRVRHTFEDFLKKLRLKAKVDFTHVPTFCGWNLCKYGIFKKPQLVLERLCVARETNNLNNCLDSYAIEVSYAYRMGELLQSYLDEEGMDAHYNCVRFIVKKRNMLKSSVGDLFRAKP
nr:MAG: replicase protein [Dracophyllum betaflexi-like virus]